MKIAIDTRLLRNQRSGMGIYLSEVLIRLKTFGNTNEYHYLNYELPRTNFFEKVWDLIYEQIWVQILLIRTIKKEKIDLLFSPNPPTSLLVPIPIVLTIPDLIFYFDPSMNWFIKLYLYWVYRLSAMKAKKIITFSMSSKKDISDILKIDINKIEVISPAAKDVFKQRLKYNEIQDIKKKFGISKKYILSIPGTFIPRKNVHDLLLSFNNLPKKIKENFEIVLVGNKNHASYEDFTKVIKDLKIEKNIIVTGYITEKELMGLYQGAFTLVVTAIYEGFALPPLEAMLERVPVLAITYGDSSLDELLQNAGIIVKDSHDLKNALLQLMTDNELRSRLIHKGLQRAKEYDWNESVKKLVAIFREEK